jgi:hypothetical protein
MQLLPFLSHLRVSARAFDAYMPRRTLNNMTVNHAVIEMMID